MTRLLLSGVCLLCFTSCHIGRFFIYNFADVKDYKKFPKKELRRSQTPFYYTEAAGTVSVTLPKTIKNGNKNYTFEAGLKKTGTQAFIIIRNDSVVYEWYRPETNASSLVASFSISKTFVSALVGMAIQDGYLRGTGDSITRYIDFLDKKQFGKITIQHLLDMQSGIAFDENYFNPFGDIAKYYYGKNLKKYLTQINVEHEPGTVFRYISLNTQLLGLILENATGMSLTDYLQKKLWTPLGMEYDAAWSIDSKKHHTEKAFCCMSGRAKDFAKLGSLYLKKGKWKGEQILLEKWVDESVNFNSVKNNLSYSNHWWHTKIATPLSDSATLTTPYYIHTPKDKNQTPFIYSASGDYFAQGLLGQYLYVYPQKNILIVRFSIHESGVTWPHLFREIAVKN